MSPRFNNLKRQLPGPTNGEAIGTGIGILAGVVVLIIVGTVVASLFAVRPARAHDTGKGWSYPWECCSDRDCEEISAARVRPVQGGYLIDGKFQVAQADVRHSPDGRYHACFPQPDVMKCFWAPPPSG